MNKETTIKELTQDEQEGNGEILEQTDEYVMYFNENAGIETQYRFNEACTDDYVKSRIFVGETAQRKGFTPEYILSVLKKAFGEYYFEAVCVMSGIIVPSNEDEFDRFMNEASRTSDNLSEWYDYESESEYCGKMFYMHQIAYINEALHEQLAEELGDEIISAEREYETGIIISLIHEVRHLMLDCNQFISEDDIPLSENAEDAVEEFARTAYEKLGSLKHFMVWN